MGIIPVEYDGCHASCSIGHPKVRWGYLRRLKASIRQRCKTLAIHGVRPRGDQFGATKFRCRSVRRLLATELVSGEGGCFQRESYYYEG